MEGYHKKGTKSHVSNTGKTSHACCPPSQLHDQRGKSRTETQKINVLRTYKLENYSSDHWAVRSDFALLLTCGTF